MERTWSFLRRESSCSTNVFANSLPPPDGPFQVGYVDIMTPGTPDQGVFFRFHYPAPAHTKVISPPVWADSETKHGLTDFVQAMAWNWPTWVNNTEFLLLPAAKKILTPKTFVSLFQFGWRTLSKKLTIPICHGAPMEDPLEKDGWPVVVFSHGMGCNRFIMSQLCYQLASQGVIVAAVEHRDGSGCGTYFVEEDGEGNKMTSVTHEHVLTDQNELSRRHEQIMLRSDEVRRTIDVLEKLNSGEIIKNFVVDSLLTSLTTIKGNLDLKKNLFLVGHSFGGSTVLLASSQDSRVRSVLALDPWMFPLTDTRFALSKPTLVINTQKFVNPNNIDVIKTAAEDTDKLKFKVMKSGVHLSATDVPAMFPSKLLRKGLGFMDKVEPSQVMKETHQLVLDWFRKVVH